MTSADFFYITVSIVLILFVVINAFLVFQFVITLKAIRSVVMNIGHFGKELDFVKEGIKFGVMNLVVKVLRKMGGEKIGK